MPSLELRMERTTEGIRLHLPEDGDAREIATMVLMTAFSTERTSPEGPGPGASAGADAFEALEAEMANDAVRDAAALQRDLQDLTADRILKQLLQEGSADAASDDELYEVALWLNHQRFAIRQSLGGTEHPLWLLCGAWSEQILEEVI